MGGIGSDCGHHEERAVDREAHQAEPERLQAAYTHATADGDDRQ